MKQAEEAKLKSEAQKTPIGDVDPSKCTAEGEGIVGGNAGPAAFVVVTKDGEGRRVVKGGEVVRVRVSPEDGVGGSEQEGIVKDVGDGTYMVSYVVPKWGIYIVNVECNGSSIMGSPFPVFFSSGTSAGGLTANGSGGVTFPGIGAGLGEVCLEHLGGRCTKTDCKLNHPPLYVLTTVLGATNSMGTLSQVPKTAADAAMAVAQAIAQAVQAHVQSQSSKDSSGTSAGGLLGTAPTSTYQNLMNQTMPNMPNYAASVSGKVTEKKDEKSEHREQKWSPSAFAKNEKICVSSPKSASTSTSGPIACPPYERFWHMRYGPVGGDKMDEAGWEKHFDEMPRGEYHKMFTRVLRDRFDLVVSREEEGPWLKELDKNSTSRSEVFKFNPDLQYMWQKGYGPPDGDKLDFKAWKEYVHNMPDDDLVAMLMDLFYRYPDLHPKPHHHQPYTDEIDYEQDEKYLQQVYATEGFDIDVYPPSGCCGAILPMFNDTGPVNAMAYDMYSDCSSIAVDDYNQREGTNYTVIRVVKVCQALVSGLMCYITFEAIESNDHLQPQVFQAQVYAPNLNKEEAEVILVRRKSGGTSRLEA